MQFTKLSKSLAGGVITVVAFGVFGTSAAYAGEITGNGKSLKNPDGSLNGRSICAFSGQNDTFIDPDTPDAEGFTRTQNWGQVSPEFRAFLASIGEHPGDACKPAAH